MPRLVSCRSLAASLSAGGGVRCGMMLCCLGSNSGDSTGGCESHKGGGWKRASTQLTFSPLFPCGQFCSSELSLLLKLFLFFHLFNNILISSLRVSRSACDYIHSSSNFSFLHPHLLTHPTLRSPPLPLVCVPSCSWECVGPALSRVQPSGSQVMKADCSPSSY